MFFRRRNILVFIWMLSTNCLGGMEIYPQRYEAGYRTNKIEEVRS